MWSSSKGARFIAILSLFFCAMSASAGGEPLNIHVAFDWLDNNGCAECTVARLRLIVDLTAHQIAASNVMLQSYSKITSSQNKAIFLDPSGGWKCSNHTADQSEPDPRLWGFNFEFCVRQVSSNGNAFVIDYLSRIKKPDGRYRLITDTAFSVNILGPTSCQVSLLSAQTAYEVAPDRMIPATAIRRQICEFVVAP